MKKTIIILLLVLFIISGCAAEHDSNGVPDEDLQGIGLDVDSVDEGLLDIEDISIDETEYEGLDI